MPCRLSAIAGVRNAGRHVAGGAHAPHPQHLSRSILHLLQVCTKGHRNTLGAAPRSTAPAANHFAVRAYSREMAGRALEASIAECLNSVIRNHTRALLSSTFVFTSAGSRLSSDGSPGPQLEVRWVMGERARSGHPSRRRLPRARRRHAKSARLRRRLRQQRPARGR